MNFKLLFTIVFLNFATLQNGEFELKKFYKNKGVIINNYDTWPFVFTNNNFSKKYYTSKEDIFLSEKFIQKNYYYYKKDLLNHFGSNSNIEQLKKAKNVKRRFINHYRQYSGFIDQNNDTIIYVYMLNIKKHKNPDEIIKHWNKSLISGNGEWFYNNQEYFLFNKSKNRLEKTY